MRKDYILKIKDTEFLLETNSEIIYGVAGNEELNDKNSKLSATIL
jgi:hypothetical protein